MHITFETGGPGWSVDDGTFAVAVRTTEGDGTIGEDTLHFGVPGGFHAHPDCVAAALSTLCGRKYAEIAFDFPVSDRCRSMIEDCYGVAIKVPGAVARRVAGPNLMLNFSGGFDSLAAMLTAGSELPMVSMDFGPPFEREERYFSSFRTNVCKTDLRQKGYGLNDWRFMASGSLLMADCLEAGAFGFGSIFEAAPWHFSPRTASGKPRSLGPFGAVGAMDVAWTRPLTEFGTAMVVLSRAPETVAPSLTSLASPGSEKLYRKQLLIEVASRRLGLPAPDRATFVKPKKRTPWGKAFTVDFLALFFVREYGRAFVEEWMDLPEDDEFAEASRGDLGFYLKYNPNLIGYIPPDIRNRVLNAFHECGLLPYNEIDFESFARVRKLLGRSYAV